MANYRRKSKWKSILCGILVVATLIGACAGIAAIGKKETKTIGAGAFSVGAIDENGIYIPKSNKSIYTEDLVECQGLSIEPDFEASGTFQVFYYAEDKSFIGATEVMQANAGTYNKFSTYAAAKYCRIMITPEAVDEDGKEDKDFKIRFYEVYGYANNYTITVNKKQNFELVNIWEEGEIVLGKIVSYDRDTLKLKEEEGKEINAYIKVDVTGSNMLKLVHIGSTSLDYTGNFFDADGNNLKGVALERGYEEVYIEVPDGAVTFALNFGTFQELELYVVR